jgi:hypothetical protein
MDDRMIGVPDQNIAFSHCKTLDYMALPFSAWEGDYAAMWRMLQSFINKV